MPHASWPKKQNIKQKQYCNKFSKDFKNGPHQKKKKITYLGFRWNKISKTPCSKKKYVLKL